MLNLREKIKSNSRKNEYSHYIRIHLDTLDKVIVLKLF